MAKLVVLLLGIVPAFESWEEAVQASKSSGPSVVVLYLSRSDCSFCRRFEKEVLKPVLASGHYDDVGIREIVLDKHRSLLRLPFAKTTAELEARYEVIGTPTLLFLSSDGNELAKKVVGYSGDDYAHYRLERSLKAVQNVEENAVPANLNSGKPEDSTTLPNTDGSSQN